MLHLLLYGLLAVVLAGCLFGLAVRFLPAGEQIAPAVRDEAPWRLPADRTIRSEEVDAIRLPVALRGYRFAETDLLLDRLAAELRARDGEIARLRSELVGAEPVAAAAAEPTQDELPLGQAEPAVASYYAAQSALFTPDIEAPDDDFEEILAVAEAIDAPPDWSEPSEFGTEQEYEDQGAEEEAPEEAEPVAEAAPVEDEAPAEVVAEAAPVEEEAPAEAVAEAARVEDEAPDEDNVLDLGPALPAHGAPELELPAFYDETARLLGVEAPEPPSAEQQPVGDPQPLEQAPTEQAVVEEQQPAPEEVAPEEAAVYEEQPAPEEAAPEEAAPEEAAPEEAAPEDAAPEEAAPEETAPEQPAPDEATLEETPVEEEEQPAPEEHNALDLGPAVPVTEVPDLQHLMPPPPPVEEPPPTVAMPVAPAAQLEPQPFNPPVFGAPAAAAAQPSYPPQEAPAPPPYTPPQTQQPVPQPVQQQPVQQPVPQPPPGYPPPQPITYIPPPPQGHWAGTAPPWAVAPMAWQPPPPAPPPQSNGAPIAPPADERPRRGRRRRRK